jgi:glycosyltransferase involved in cell wall biosynthesis
MRIGLIAPPWVAVPPPAYGGTEMVVDALARGYSSAGHDVTLYSTADATCPVERRWTYEQGRGDQIGNMAVEARHVLDAYEALAGSDLIHDHTLLGPVVASHICTSPVVTTVHSPFDEDLQHLYRRPAQQIAVVAISHDQAARAGLVRVTRVIHHGIDLADVPVGQGHGGYVAFLGRMTPDKGAHIAIRAARAAGVPIRIASKIWAESEKRYFTEQIAPLARTPGVELLGELDAPKKFDMLGGATALLAPLRWPEPFGLFMIESLAVGTPVIAFPTGAAPEIIQHATTGYLPEDEPSMVSAIAQTDRIDRNACRTSIAEHFSAGRMVADYLTLFDEILTGRLNRPQTTPHHPQPPPDEPPAAGSQPVR